jgi:uncharacterized protein Veg
MKTMSEVLLPDIGQTIIIRENFGKKKIREVKCTVEGVYKTFILVEHQDNKTRESFMKVDFFTGYIDYRKCV